MKMPWFPSRGIIGGFFERAQMTECPGHLISVSFKISVSSEISSNDLSEFFGHAGLFGNTNFHELNSCFDRLNHRIQSCCLCLKRTLIQDHCDLIVRFWKMKRVKLNLFQHPDFKFCLLLGWLKIAD